MDFSTLELHSGNYITPLFEEKFEDLVWSVEVEWQGTRQQVYLYILLEFQSTIDHSMPIRLMHYVACFYDHLIKNKVTTPGQGLPPVFPLVVYNGLQRWTAKQDIYEMVNPEPPEFLRPYQPHLRYYLVDEGSYSEDELEAQKSALSGVFGIEKASESRELLQVAVDRIVGLIEQDPNKERLDRVITRWLKRHLQRLGADVQLEELNSLVEDKDMLAENLEHWAERERRQGRQEGEQAGMTKGVRQTAINLIALGVLSDEQISVATGLSTSEIETLRQGQHKH